MKLPLAPEGLSSLDDAVAPNRFFQNYFEIVGNKFLRLNIMKITLTLLLLLQGRLTGIDLLCQQFVVSQTVLIGCRILHYICSNCQTQSSECCYVFCLDTFPKNNQKKLQIQSHANGV